jgi:hypothetical protein
MSAVQELYRLLKRRTYRADAHVRFELAQCQRNRFDEGKPVTQTFDDVVWLPQPESQLRGGFAVGTRIWRRTSRVRPAPANLGPFGFASLAVMSAGLLQDRLLRSHGLLLAEGAVVRRPSVLQHRRAPLE